MTENDSMTVNSQSVDRVQVLEGALTYVQRHVESLQTVANTLQSLCWARSSHGRVPIMSGLEFINALCDEIVGAITAAKQTCADGEE